MTDPTIEAVRQVRFDPDVTGFAVTEAAPAGVDAEWVDIDDQETTCTLLYFHGGGYLAGRAEQYRGATVSLARAMSARALVPNYRLAPEAPFPAAYEDCLSVYRWLLEDSAVDSERLVVAGDSAGGALVASVLAGARDAGLAMPRCGVINSPYADLSASSPSLDDPRLNAGRYTKERVTWMMRTYLEVNDADPRDPRLSPVYGDLNGLPPLLIQVGGLDNLHDDGVRLGDAARAAGVDVTLTQYPTSEHIWVVRGTNPADPEAAKAVEEADAFVRTQLEGVTVS
jgi:monoterpene epsilon-lactone hydrolase